MKTKFNCLLVATSVVVTLFSCKKKTDEVKPTETDTSVAQEVIFRPKKVFVSGDSSSYRLVFENEYDELGRLKVEDYYYDTLNGGDDPQLLFRKMYSYSNRYVSTKQFVKTKSEYANFYGQSGWDSLFFDNPDVKKRYKAFGTYLSLLVNGNDTTGAKSFFEYTYISKGDTTIINSKGEKHDQPADFTTYIDKNNVVVKKTESTSTYINNYKLEGNGKFGCTYISNYFFNENLRVFSYIERVYPYESETAKRLLNFNWTFDAQGRPTRLTLVENAEGVMTKSYYRYEY